MPGRDIIVVGGSAGGVQAVIEFCRHLPAELPAAVFVVIHLSSEHESILAELLSDSALPASSATDGEKIRYEHVYVAPPDCHLLLSRDHVRVVRGPHYNRHRPAIDPLFHSATRAFGPRVVGIVLSGTLDDGAAGLASIQRRGGIAIVQKPETAQSPDMPKAAIALVEPNYLLAPAEMGTILGRLARERIDDAMPPAERRLDAEFDNLVGKKIDMSDAGTPSKYACPVCSGVLWEVDQAGLLQFHCSTGHTFSPSNLLAEHDGALEDSLWAALRALEENIHLRRNVAESMRHLPRVSRSIDEQVEEAERHAERLRDVLLAHGKAREKSKS